jgi:eukaryotic-like serine/threonine-protein kinase
MNDRRQIGPYDILGPLGAGGMSEVYRARDSRLNREVAVKILPSDVAGDRIRRQRFLEEARAAAGLSHPNILAVFDFNVTDDTPYIVSELLDGGQLRDDIDRGAIPIKRLLDLAGQIAAGLSAAHAAGIVHRDLKPENVMVTRNGRVKIVDFGLAKDYAALGGAIDGGGPTTLTLPGAILGTPYYMSPEQASGGVVDFRSDQFAFGLVLYEMATGVQPFRRATPVQTMSAIVAEEAEPLAQLNDRIPLPLQWIIERCLAKDPDDRYAATADLAKDLTTLQRRLDEVSKQHAGRSAASALARLTLPLVAAAAIVVLAAGMAVMPSASSPALRFTPFVTDAAFQGAPAWSPDGNTLAYVSPVDGILQVFTKSVTSPLVQPLTECRFDCRDPFWAPDGTRIYYHSLARDAESLWSVSAAGGPPQLVLENALQAAISPDGRTLAFFREAETDQTLLGASQSIWLASPDGTDARRYTESPFDQRTFVAGTSRFSPDGSKLLAWVWGWQEASTIPQPAFWVLPFPTGRPYRVLPELSRAASAAPSFDWFPDGRHVVVSLWDAAMTGTHLWVVDVETGARRPLTSEIGSENRPAVAPDGRRIAFTSEAIDFDLVTLPLDGSPPRPLLATSRNELDPAFAADGSEYAYVSDKTGVLQIWVRSTSDSRFDRLVVSGDEFGQDATLALGSLALSPDKQRISFQRYGERSGYQIWVSTLAAAGPPVPLTAASLYQDGPTWSPDGAWIAFVERTPQEVFVLSKVQVGVSAPPVTILPQVPKAGGRPRWSPDGRWILCDTTDGLVIVRPDGSDPHVISEETWIAYTWSADSRRVYGLREADRPGHLVLGAIDIETRREWVVNPELGVIPPAFQAIRGLERIGSDALVTSIARSRSDIWLAEGPRLFLGQRRLLDRLWRAAP